MRCLIKAAAMHKFGIDKSTKVDQLRQLLKEKNCVGPGEWFQAMLAQGVLFLNASLTIGPKEEGKRGGALHTKFWKPVVECIIDQILEERKGKGIVFAWWGGESLKTKRALKNIFKKHEGKVDIKHVENKNPAAMADAFCDDPNVFSTLNNLLISLALQPVDWLPIQGWQLELTDGLKMPTKKRKQSKKGDKTPDAKEPSAKKTKIQEMGAFITETQDLHKMYLERLMDGLQQGQIELADIVGIFLVPLVSLVEACKVLHLESAAERSIQFVKAAKRGNLEVDEAAAIHMYTTNSIYRKLNGSMRDPNRKKANAYFSYLRLVLSAMKKMDSGQKILFRGVGLDLSKDYKVGTCVTWWAISSCTPNESVASAFASTSSKSTIFHISTQHAVGIRHLSMYSHEEEFVLAPGTQLRVEEVKKSKGRHEIHLTELGPETRRVS